MVQQHEVLLNEYNSLAEHLMAKENNRMIDL